MKNKYKYYVTDWAPNGCNTLIVTDQNNNIVDVLDEVLFGIDVSKLRNPDMLFTDDTNDGAYRVSKALIKKHVTSGPFGFQFKENCFALSRYL